MLTFALRHVHMFYRYTSLTIGRLCGSSLLVDAITLYGYATHGLLRLFYLLATNSSPSSTSFE